MNTFRLIRDVDPTGISGTGVVAEGVQFSDGQVVMRWLTSRASTVVWDGIGPAMAIHGHGGATRLVWDQQYQPTQENL